MEAAITATGVWLVALRWLATTLTLLLLHGCAALPGGMTRRMDALLPTDVVLIGEQHDAPEHQALQQAAVTELARRGSLAALALEMAEQGRSTSGLPATATEAEVRTALAWNQSGWDWARYGPAVMAAVRHGVPVLGANLPRSAMRATMAEEAWDRHLATAALEQQRDDIRSGHCDLLPASQINPMTRIQIARDAAMAVTITGAAQPGKTVVLIAGAAHVLRATGVPTHLPRALETRVVLEVAGSAMQPRRLHADQVWRTVAVPPKDHCAGLQQKLTR